MYKTFDIMSVEAVTFHNGEPVNFVKQITTEKITERYLLTIFKEDIATKNSSNSISSSRKNLETIWKIMMYHAKEVAVNLFSLGS